jgi:hypothetical protein
VPDRILRVGILTSEPVNRLSWPAEVFYRRLMSVVDDFGRYDGRPAVLRAALYALKVDRVSEPDIGKWIRESEEAGLVRRYTVTEKPYLEISKFDQKVRAVKSKWPDPPTIAGNCQQTSANASVVEVGIVVGDECACTPVAESATAPPAIREAKPVKKNGVHKPLNDGPVVISIPLVGNEEYEVHQGLVDELEKLYPAVDVPQTLREIRGWNLTRPSQRKTANGVLKHINTWLAKEQNKG